MSLKVKFTPQARNDVRKIATYSNTHWGREQARKYLQGLNDRVLWLGAHPNLGAERPEIARKLRSFPQGSHVIYYRVQDDRIEIIAVLHKSMDVENRL